MAPVVVGPIDGFGILGAGTAFPSKRYTNRDVLALLPRGAWARRQITEDEELSFLAKGLEETMGVRERAWAHVPGTPFNHLEEPSVLELGIEAAKQALADAKLEGKDIRALICSTSTPHRMTSTVSAGIGAALGVHGACMDVRTGCAGGLFGLLQLSLMHQAGIGPVLLVGAETFSKVIPALSKEAALALADGAGALVLGSVKTARLHSVAVESDGSLSGLVRTEGALPPTLEAMERGDYLLSGQPALLTEAVLERYGWITRAALERASCLPAQVDRYVPHQPSRDVVNKVAAGLGLPPDRVFGNTLLHANVGAAGWVVAVAEARAQRFVEPGHTTLIAAVGGGMSWGSAVWTWG